MSAIIWMKISLFLFLPIHSLLSCKMPWISRLSLRGSDCRIIEECLNQPIHGVTGRNQSSNVLFNKVKFNFTPKKIQISPCIAECFTFSIVGCTWKDCCRHLPSVQPILRIQETCSTNPSLPRSHTWRYFFNSFAQGFPGLTDDHW